MNRGLTITAFVLIALGVMCGALETIFYGGHLDENNVIQESLFLPLTFIFIALGIFVFSVTLLVTLLKWIVQKNKA